MTASAPEAPSPAGQAGPEERRAGRLPGRLRLPLLAVLTLLVALAAPALGRYVVPPNEIVRLLAGQFLPVDRTWTGNEESVALNVRLPRVLLSLLGGAALQGVFRNPLVSPDVIGVASGASFGGVLAMLLGVGSLGAVTDAFGFRRGPRLHPRPPPRHHDGPRCTTTAPASCRARPSSCWACCAGPPSRVEGMTGLNSLSRAMY
ncbi:iron chelate uptake ABC transporter family permease subunit [Streptomyces albidoflavus]|uniref:iron chelate uptake ABC transporter family permease subunit n=1 Tax=Streptomyces albidoflavus TaxID=1886 RepID=UPI0033A90D90